MGRLGNFVHKLAKSRASLLPHSETQRVLDEEREFVGKDADGEQNNGAILEEVYTPAGQAPEVEYDCYSR